MGILIPDFDSVLAEARIRKSKGDEFARNVEYWLSKISVTKAKNNRFKNLSEREKICALCPNSSKGGKWCCVNRVSLVDISKIEQPPEGCPYVLELVVLGEKE